MASDVKINTQEPLINEPAQRQTEGTGSQIGTINGRKVVTIVLGATALLAVTAAIVSLIFAFYIAAAVCAAIFLTTAITAVIVSRKTPPTPEDQKIQKLQVEFCNPAVEFCNPVSEATEFHPASSHQDQPLKSAQAPITPTLLIERTATGSSQPEKEALDIEELPFNDKAIKKPENRELEEIETIKNFLEISFKNLRDVSLQAIQDKYDAYEKTLNDILKESTLKGATKPPKKLNNKVNSLLKTAMREREKEKKLINEQYNARAVDLKSSRDELEKQNLELLQQIQAKRKEINFHSMGINEHALTDIKKEMVGQLVKNERSIFTEVLEKWNKQLEDHKS